MKNLNRSKIVGVAAVSLAAVSLIGVGFASWVVEGINVKKKDQTVSVTVGEITDNRVTVTAAATDPDLAFDSNSTNGEVFKGSSETAADMNFVLTFKVAVETGSKFFESNSLNVTLTFSGSLVTLLTTNTSYLTLEKDTDNSMTKSSEFVYTQKVTTDGTYTAAFKFKWGQTFNNDNPGAITKKQVETGTVNVTNCVNALKDLRASNSITGTFTAEPGTK